MKTTLVWILVGSLAITNIVLLVLYGYERESSPDISATIVQSDDSSAMEFAQTIGEVGQTGPSRTSYAATFGNFSLSLDPAYRVIVENDGGTEELRSAKLKIARQLGESHDVVASALDDAVNVEAYPSDIHGNRDRFVSNDSAIQGVFRGESAALVDGVEARVFSLNGVGETRKYFFERAGVTYLIEAWDVSTGDTQVMLDDVLGGFTFN